jgi:WD40 repeat protein
MIPALLAALLLVPAQEKKDDKLKPIAVVPYTGGDIDFEKHVQPILDNKCTTCHSGSNKKGRLDLSSYDTMLKGGKTGPALVPGKPADSLMLKLSGKTQKPAMPPEEDEPLTPQELALLTAWVKQGAKGSTSTAPKVAAPVKMTKLAGRLKPVLALGITTDKKTIAVGRGASVALYSADKGDLIRTLTDANLKDDAGKPIEQSQLDLVQSLLFSPDGKTLYVGGYQEVTLWDATSGKLLSKFTGFADRVAALDLSPDGKLLAVAGGAPTQDGELVLIDLSTGKPVRKWNAPHSDTVYGVRFSPDGRMLASAGADKFVKVWALQPLLRPEPTGQAVATMLHCINPWSLPAVTATRQVLELKYLQSIDISFTPPGTQLRQFEGHTHHVLDVAWRADSKVLVSAGADNVLKVWDYEKGEQIRTIAGHTKQISRLSMLRTAPQVISACGDAGLRQWNIDNGSNVRSYQGATDFLQAVTASADGTVIVAGGEEGVVRVYNGQNGTLVKTIK